MSETVEEKCPEPECPNPVSPGDTHCPVHVPAVPDPLGPEITTETTRPEQSGDPEDATATSV